MGGHHHRTKTVITQGILDANDAIAEANREKLDRAGVFVINLMSSPGAGKTTLLERTLARLQDHVEPFPYAEVQAILTEELGVRLSKAFQSIDERPLAAASMAQVHHAVLRDGREVALKVQRPGRAPMEASAFLRGYLLPVGTRLVEAAGGA